MDAYKVCCETCGWFNKSADFGYTLNAGRVHEEILKPGHSVQSIVTEPGGWVR